MKDIIITSQKIKRERNIYLICFLLSFAINIIAILAIHVRGLKYSLNWGMCSLSVFSSISYYGFRVYSLSGYVISFEKRSNSFTFFED